MYLSTCQRKFCHLTWCDSNQLIDNGIKRALACGRTGKIIRLRCIIVISESRIGRPLAVCHENSTRGCGAPWSALTIHRWSFCWLCYFLYHAGKNCNSIHRHDTDVDVS